MRFAFTLPETKPLEIEVRFSRLTWRIHIFVNGALVLKRWWWVWPERTGWERMLIGDNAERELILQVEKQRRFAGVLPFTYRVFVDRALVFQKHGY